MKTTQVRNKTMRRQRLQVVARIPWLLMGVLALAWGGTLPAQAAQTLTQLKIVYPTGAVATFGLVWIAKEAGLLSREGIEAELVAISGSSKIVQVLVAGEAGLAHAGGPPFITANLNGADTVIIAAASNRPIGLSVMALPEIKSMKDLKGKSIGVTRFGSSTDFFTRSLLPHFGLQPDRDVAVMQMGGMPEIFAGLTSKGIAAGILSLPLNLRARDMGYTELTNSAEAGVVYPQAVVGTTRAFIAKNEALLHRFTKAFAEAIKVAKTDAPLSQKVIARYTRTTDPALLREMYREWSRNIESNPRPSLESIKTALDTTMDPKAKQADPRQFVDFRFVDALK